MCAGLCCSEKGYYYFPGPLGIRTVHRAALLLARKETLDFLRSHAASGTLGPSSEQGNSLSPSIPTPGQDLVSFWGSPCNGAYCSLPPPRVEAQRPVMIIGFGRGVFTKMILKRGLHNPHQHDSAVKRTDFS